MMRKNLLSFYFLLFAFYFFTGWVRPVKAEGSRNLYPSGETGSRANLEWRTSRYGPTTPANNSLLRRTLLQVYAKKDEYILLGSSAMGVDNGDILLYGNKTGRVGDETLSDLKFQCSQQRSLTGNTANQGKITNRNQELAGPDTITNSTTATPGSQVTNGYVPCYYQAPADGIYYVAFHGPLGANSNDDASVAGDVALTNGGNFNSNQKTSVAAWDVTVRSSLTSTTDINGRLFADYLALFTGSNGRPINSEFYLITKDGYRYRTDFNGLDPNGFVVYGNDVGYYDSDGKTPLYHNVLGNNGQLSTLEGSTNLALPTHLIFFSNTMTNGVEVERILFERNIPSIPIFPQVTNPTFTGTSTGNTSNQNTGGNFQFSSNVPGSYEVVISRDGTNLDPFNPQNRLLRGVMTTSGVQTVNWDGKDNSGNFFPVGNNYKVQIKARNGEYHFPLLDAENSTKGGPSFNLLNTTNPIGNTKGFYDDRGYRTLSGVNVGTPGTILCGGSAPSTAFSDPVNGFDTTGNQRAFGTSNGGNTNASCTGSFGDVKGLDIWTYVPSQAEITFLNIIPTAPDLTITKSHTGDFTRGTTGTYTIAVKNSGNAPTAGTVTVTDTLPTGLTPTGFTPTPTTPTGWNCSISNQTVTCTRTDALAAGSSYPNIGIVVDVAQNAPASLTNTATVAGGGETKTDNNTANDPTNIVGGGTVKLVLAKRITRINGVDINNFVDDPNTTDDNDAKWPAGYLKGAINGGVVKPGDELEYTIYFLSNGDRAIKNVSICDLVPDNTTFIPTAFNGLTPTDSGVGGSDSGISLTIGSATVYLTNIQDNNDRGEFFPAGTTAPAACNRGAFGNTTPPPLAGVDNKTGAVIVNVVTGATTLPDTAANVSGYGFIRFRAKVK
ncbi:MAG: hypothetical protein KME64_20510 [Scytonematopsis contorta HA4267-MV1]|jgi:uncharacterized repeat protein (TIGR01451 family)|nr:hypothetical protein [Scytonematopsis contorta HA4267-MV1]